MARTPMLLAAALLSAAIGVGGAAGPVMAQGHESNHGFRVFLLSHHLQHWKKHWDHHPRPHEEKVTICHLAGRRPKTECKDCHH